MAKDPWPRVLSLPGAQGGFVGDPASLARDNIFPGANMVRKCIRVTHFKYTFGILLLIL